MRAARLGISWDQRPEEGVCQRCTSELLTLVLDAAGVEPHVVDAVARAIDAGDLAYAATTPGEWSAADHLAPAVATVLMVAFELARRAALPSAPDAIRGPADVAAVARRELGGRRREHVLVIACDAGNRPLRTDVVAQGAAGRVPVPVREILNAVLRCDGRAFALAHNHPGGDAEPSDSDIDATAHVAEAARVVGLRFLGHVVVAEDRWAPVATRALRTPC